VRAPTPVYSVSSGERSQLAQMKIPEPISTTTTAMAIICARCRPPKIAKAVAVMARARQRTSSFFQAWEISLELLTHLDETDSQDVEQSKESDCDCYVHPPPPH